MKFATILLLAATSPAWAADNKPADKPWTALFVYGGGRVAANEHLQNEKTCREAICAVRWQMSCDDKAAKDKKEAEAREKAAQGREAKIVEYRLTHACKIATEEGYEVSSKEKKTISTLHCPLPDGGERVYDKDGKKMFDTSPMIGDGAYYISGIAPESLVYSACFQ